MTTFLATPLSLPGLHTDPATARLLSAALSHFLDETDHDGVARFVDEYGPYDSGAFAPLTGDALIAAVRDDIASYRDTLDHVARGEAVDE